MTFGTFAFKKRTEYNRRLKARHEAQVTVYKDSLWEKSSGILFDFPARPAKLTQQMMADILGFPQRNGYQRLEKDQREWKPAEKEALAKMLGKSLKELEAEYEAWVLTREEA